MCLTIDGSPELDDLSKRLFTAAVVLLPLGYASQLSKVLIHGLVHTIIEVRFLFLQDSLHASSSISNPALLHFDYSNELLCSPNEIVTLDSLVLFNLDHVHLCEEALKLSHQLLLLSLFLIRRLRQSLSTRHSKLGRELRRDHLLLTRLLNSQSLHLHKKTLDGKL